MNIEKHISSCAHEALRSLYGDVAAEAVQVQKTRKEFDGDYTLVVFPFLKQSRKSPELTAEEVGRKICEMCPEVESFNVVKGFLNMSLATSFWRERFCGLVLDGGFGFGHKGEDRVMVEY
ncbi:MAG: arginine--tRNA ligase, partial [Rikenellaceae bacterium]|nr:arginine--tRNA ligase [Rikenellaceae bacterium]